jgi:hypothetical protein
LCGGEICKEKGGEGWSRASHPQLKGCCHIQRICGFLIRSLKWKPQSGLIRGKSYLKVFCLVDNAPLLTKDVLGHKNKRIF